MPSLEITTSFAVQAKAPVSFPSLWNAKGTPSDTVYLLVRRNAQFDAPRMPGAAGLDYSLVAIPLDTKGSLDTLNLQGGVDLTNFTPFVGTVTLESK